MKDTSLARKEIYEILTRIFNTWQDQPENYSSPFRKQNFSDESVQNIAEKAVKFEDEQDPDKTVLVSHTNDEPIIKKTPVYQNISGDGEVGQIEKTIIITADKIQSLSLPPDEEAAKSQPDTKAGKGPGNARYNANDFNKELDQTILLRPEEKPGSNEQTRIIHQDRDDLDKTVIISPEKEQISSSTSGSDNYDSGHPVQGGRIGGALSTENQLEATSETRPDVKVESGEDLEKTVILRPMKTEQDEK